MMALNQIQFTQAKSWSLTWLISSHVFPDQKDLTIELKLPACNKISDLASPHQLASRVSTSPKTNLLPKESSNSKEPSMSSNTVQLSSLPSLVAPTPQTQV